MAPASAGAIFCFLKLDALRRLGDGSQQLHQLALVHPAAVVGKGVEAALHAEREQNAPVQISREGRVGFLKALAQALLDVVILIASLVSYSKKKDKAAAEKKARIDEAYYTMWNDENK